MRSVSSKVYPERTQPLFWGGRLAETPEMPGQSASNYKLALRRCRGSFRRSSSPSTRMSKAQNCTSCLRVQGVKVRDAIDAKHEEPFGRPREGAKISFCRSAPFIFVWIICGKLKIVARLPHSSPKMRHRRTCMGHRRLGEIALSPNC